jgi:hypothetical protein
MRRIWVGLGLFAAACGGAESTSSAPDGVSVDSSDLGAPEDTTPDTGEPADTAGDPRDIADGEGADAEAGVDTVLADVVVPADVAEGGADSSDSGVAGVVTELPAGLNGIPKSPFGPAPTFESVVDNAGNLVDQDALLGSPTVLWFFPAANTTG